MQKPMSRSFVFAALLALPLALAACGEDDPPSQPSSGTGGSGGTGAGGAGGGSAEDLEMQAGDFDCILEWDQVRLFRITNKLGNLAGSLAVANEPGSGDYPVGTVIQLVPNEAMVKRRAGFSPETSDWEFFLLDAQATGTTIVQRGTTEVTNMFGNCFDCHNLAQPQFDLICEKDHGCDPLPVGDDVLLGVQNGDPRCMAGN
ncbi:MAG TPA: hypothetical protein VLS89_10330 [Candidatus Nanopelagicales bacterium]|nr:hypothetical protein [Candidatus Nanopelagicales bacterium]